MTFPTLPGAVAGLLPTILGIRSWQDRLREAAYTDPKGTRRRFEYEDVGREYNLRGTVHEFADVDGAFVQGTGLGPRLYPMRIFFSGRDHDLFATDFEKGLITPGIGKLEHPIYGTIPKVMPLGTVTRRDDLKTAANQTIIEVTFFTTLGVLYPKSRSHPQSEILTAIDGFNAANAQQFTGSIKVSSLVQKANLIATIRKQIGNVSRALKATADSVSAVSRTFREIQSTINFGLDVLIGQPLGLALQISNLIQAPARALAGIASRLEAYDRLAKDIFGSDAGKPAQTIGPGQIIQVRVDRVTNDFHASSLVASNAVAGSIIAVSASPIGEAGVERSALRSGAQFSTKPQALAAALAVNAQFDDLVTWKDEGFSALEDLPIGAYQVDTGESYQALQKAVALATGFLIQVSFTLVPEFRLVLDRDRSILDVAAQVYRAVDDDTLNFLISTNNLTGDAILELPKGRTVLYYPDGNRR